MSAPTTTRPSRPTVHLTPLELLLQGHPDEFLPVPARPELAGEPSDLELMVRCAESWIGRAVLTDQERERIAAVWIGDEYRSAWNLETGRRDELRSLITRRAA